MFNFLKSNVDNSIHKYKPYPRYAPFQYIEYYFEQSFLDYDMNTISLYKRNKQKFKKQKITRRYVVFADSSSKVKTGILRRKIRIKPVIFLCHGTNQTATNSSLYEQYNDNYSRKWQEYARENDLILVFLESRSWINNITKDIEGIWLPGKPDLDYFDSVYNEISQRYYVDFKKMFCVGHSNGGMFMSDLIVHANGRLAGVVNHMGGLEKDPKLLTNLIDDISLLNTPLIFQKKNNSKTKCPYLIITSTSEENRLPCHYAFDTFSNKEWDVSFIELKGIRHNFYSYSATLCWEFFTSIIYEEDLTLINYTPHSEDKVVSIVNFSYSDRDCLTSSNNSLSLASSARIMANITNNNSNNNEDNFNLDEDYDERTIADNLDIDVFDHDVIDDKAYLNIFNIYNSKRNYNKNKNNNNNNNNSDNETDFPEESNNFSSFNGISRNLEALLLV